MKSLPKVFSKPIEKDMKNNRDFFYSRLMDEKNDSKNILKEIDAIFKSKNFVYKSKVEITTSNEIIETFLVGKSGNRLLTLDGKSILITDIKKIKKL